MCYAQLSRNCSQALEIGNCLGFCLPGFYSTITWDCFTESLTKAEKVLRNNQYPKAVIQSIINKTLNNILSKRVETKHNACAAEKSSRTLFALALQYRGPGSETLAHNIKKIFGTRNIYFTTERLKLCTPSLKSKLSFSLRSNVVYHILVVAVRHLSTRTQDHGRAGMPV